ncbi:hypothetical protein EVA_16367 [gut metagenome]|uniref:Uncharacterized protein n=1 Tax=gut metagenome TaxID=749906 RepID=J9FKX4_9ZZZZ
MGGRGQNKEISLKTFPNLIHYFRIKNHTCSIHCLRICDNEHRNLPFHSHSL